VNKFTNVITSNRY